MEKPAHLSLILCRLLLVIQAKIVTGRENRDHRVVCTPAGGQVDGLRLDYACQALQEKLMAKHHTYSLEFKRQVAQEYLSGEESLNVSHGR